MIRVAVTSENPIIVDGVKAGVKKGFKEYFSDSNEEIKVNFFEINALRLRENIEGELIKKLETRMKTLRKTVNDDTDEKKIVDYDYFVCIEDGLFSKGGYFFYSQVAYIQALNARDLKMFGTSSGILISDNKLLDVIGKGFTNCYSNADIVAVTHKKFSYTSLTKQAVEMALASRFL